MNVQIDVPVTLMKSDDGYWLKVKNSLGQEAMLSLEIGGPLTTEIVKTWADEQMKAGLLKRRRKTGLKDSNGRVAFEADIMLSQAGVRGVVAWDANLAAFVIRTATSQTVNLGPIAKWEVIGNAFENPELL